MADTGAYRNALPAGSSLVEYEVRAALGAGAFGITYLAWDTRLRKQVTLKEYLPADIALRGSSGGAISVVDGRDYEYARGRERFLEQARVLARFGHPHVVRVDHCFEANGTAYMVMDYEDGESMSRWLGREPFPAEDRLRDIVLPLLDGLRAVHGAGLLHRDIKPSNILLREQGGPVVVDFGAVRDAIGGAASRAAPVTPGYVPPEHQSAEGHQGPWSDIYAVAGILFRAVTNVHPPDARSRMRNDSVPAALRQAQARYSVGLLRAIGWGLALCERNRPQTVEAWVDGIRDAALVPYEMSGRVVPQKDARSDRSPWLPLALRRIPRIRPRVAQWLVPLVILVAAIAGRGYVTRDDGGIASRESAKVAGRVPAAASEAAGRPAQQRAAGETVSTGDIKANGKREPVALPLLREFARERPGRDRSERP